MSDDIPREVNRLRRDLNNLADDTARLCGSVPDLASDKFAAAYAQLLNRLGQTCSAVVQIEDDVADRTRHAARRAARLVREHPIGTASVLLGTTLAIGLWAWGRERRSR